MAIYYPRYSTWNGPTIHLEDLIVSEQYKGKGIGTQLYSNFIKMAFNSGVKRVEWNVLDWNSPAINFIKKVGLKFWTIGDQSKCTIRNEEIFENKEH